MHHKITGPGPNPSGLCMCGCGNHVPLASRSNTLKGLVQGKPVRYIQGHAPRWNKRTDVPNPSGMCLCGCGKPTPIARKTRGQNIKGHPMSFVPGHEKYWLEVPPSHAYRLDEKTGCWVWTGHTDKGGYAVTTFRGKGGVVHRFVYEHHQGPIPAGMTIDHLCRNPSCINPDHMEAVSMRENLRRSSRIKLAPESVRRIRWLRGVELQRITAARYGVSVSLVGLVQSRKIWVDVE